MWTCSEASKAVFAKSAVEGKMPSECPASFHRCRELMAQLNLEEMFSSANLVHHFWITVPVFIVVN
jgi:hypothetical protein